MKRLFLLITICVASANISLAQHYISLSGQVGEHTWFGNIPCAQYASFGYAGGLGVNYELKYYHFLLSTGVHANISRSSFKSQNDFAFGVPYDGDAYEHGSAGKLDSIGNEFIYNYTFYNRQDQYTNLELQVPVMFGGQWNNFYFLLGAKLSSHTLWGQWNSVALFNSRGIYDKNFTPFENLEEYGFFRDATTPKFKEQYSIIDEFNKDANTTKARESARFNWNVLASLELGYTSDNLESFSPKSHKVMHYRYRIGAYLDYGVLDGFANLQKSATVAPEYDYTKPAIMRDKLVLNSLVASDERKHRADGTPTSIHPIQLGVKFTFMFQMPQKKPCPFCKEMHKAVRTSKKNAKPIEN
ncbi:MAG: hypothetical protein MJZ89_05740 [Paludibacteraceae bacterium]|nr:hypothetical protein [Paludibacteraceae bacterium]